MNNTIGDIIKILVALKSTSRTGWMLRGVPHSVAETISEHMEDASILSLVLAQLLRDKGIEVSPEKASSLATIHDVAEAYIGDIVKLTSRSLGEDAKEKLELEAVAKNLGRNTIIYKLLEEYILQTSIEAKIAKLSETVATLIQGLVYSEQGFRVSEIICSMYESAREQLKGELALLTDTLEILLDNAKKYCSSGGSDEGTTRRASKRL